MPHPSGRQLLASENGSGFVHESPGAQDSGESNEQQASGSFITGFNSIRMLEVMLKQEPIDYFEPEEIKTPVVAKNLKCTFCLEMFAEEVNRTEQRTKMEYVLATSMGPSSEAICCSQCWRMFELFYDFKKSCLTVLSRSYMYVPKNIEAKSDRQTLDASRMENDDYQMLSSVQVTSGPENPLQCDVCNATFSSNTERRLHLNIHYGTKPFKCQNLGCEKTFFLPKERNKHSMECPAPAPEKQFFECMACYQVFIEADTLQKHLSTTSCGAENQQPYGGSGIDPLHRVSAPQKNPGNCSNLPEELQTPGSPAVSDQSDEWTKTDSIEESEILLPKNGLRCTKCNINVVYRDITEIRKHKPRCLGGNNGSKDSDIDNLGAESVCQRCNIRFPNPKQAKHHVRRCQKQPEPLIDANKLQCPQCPKIFFSNYKYKCHIDKHNDIRPFPCQASGCTKRFFTKGLRRDHEQNIHNGKKTICNICGITVSSGGYGSHMRQLHYERRFACEICEKRFIQKKDLLKHSSVHTGERNFECKVCGKKFKSSEANRVHQRIHTQEKPYGCTICGVRFTYNCLLKAHMEKGCVYNIN